MRVVYGARCSWWDTIDKASLLPSGLPSCPYCGGTLFEMPSEREWWESIEKAQRAGDVPSDYWEMIRWGQGRCFGAFPNLRAAWEQRGEAAG